MSKKKYGLKGYTSRGRMALCRVTFHHPDGGVVMFESIYENGAYGTIIDWEGDAAMVLTSEHMAAVATLMNDKTFISEADNGGNSE